MTDRSPELFHLPPHLREACSILALGIMRLRAHGVKDIASEPGSQEVISLHFVADQSGHAKPKHRRQA